MIQEISVILPVFNGGTYLKQSVESVLNQNYLNFQFIILDDCSNDGSWEYLKSLKDERIMLFRNNINKGLFYNLNFLIAQSTTNLIKLWAQDDIMYPDCLASFVRFHHQHSNLGFSYSDRDTIDENGIIKENKRVDNTPEIISTQLHAMIAYYTGSIAGNIANTCINKNALDKVGPFNEQMKISADFDMWVRLAEHYQTGFIREKLIQLRDHSGQLSRNEKYYINHVREDLQVYKYLDGYVSQSQKRAGHELMRNNKLIFYYTLMLKTLMKGRLHNFAEYFKALSSFDNLLLLTRSFIKVKILKQKRTFQI